MDVLPILDSLTSCLMFAQTMGGTEETTSETASNLTTYLTNAGIVLGIFVLPFVISHFITRSIRMPSHSTRLGLMLAAISGGFIFAWVNDFKLETGVDMSGGTQLVYTIIQDGDQKIDPGALASALGGRINPSGTQEIVIRPLGDSQIQITVPVTDEMAISALKETLIKTGQMEFRIVANTKDHIDIIDLARAQNATHPLATDVLGADGHVVGRWYRVARESEKRERRFPLKTGITRDIVREAYTGKIFEVPNLADNGEFAVDDWLTENGIRDVDTLMAFEYAKRPFEVVLGDDLASASTTFNTTTGSPEVSFKLSPAGGAKMLRLTGGINTSEEDYKRRMAIIMDGEIQTAPELNSAISSQGVIQGRFTRKEVEDTVTILRSGRLPATLEKEPASERVVGAGLGEATIRKGTTASMWAVLATFACILAYYRFAGVVASIALMINGLLIFGTMIFIRQPLTLPGLAGLVLTVGMSVDANVLIFERIREEKKKGSAPRMAIRNGFDRAFTTIIDSNLTTLIAAMVLYWIGTDQVRGFAVALIIGIATSMFTATFCSRIIFEICEKLKIVSLSMSDGVGMIKSSMLGDKDVDFMSARKLSFLFSIVLVIAGLLGVFVRGKDILNIDFTGGASVTFQLTEPVPADTMRELTQKILQPKEGEQPIQSSLVRIEQDPADTVYTLVTSIKDKNELAKRLLEGLGKENMKVETYRLKYLSKTKLASF